MNYRSTFAFITYNTSCFLKLVFLAIIFFQSKNGDSQSGYSFYVILVAEIINFSCDIFMLFYLIYIMTIFIKLFDFKSNCAYLKIFGLMAPLIITIIANILKAHYFIFEFTVFINTYTNFDSDPNACQRHSNNNYFEPTLISIIIENIANYCNFFIGMFILSIFLYFARNY